MVVWLRFVSNCDCLLVCFGCNISEFCSGCNDSAVDVMSVEISSLAAACFLERFRFTVKEQSVLLSPAVVLAPFLVLEAVGAADGSGEVGSSSLKMGSPCSSNKFAVSISQTGYFRDLPQ